MSNVLVRTQIIFALLLFISLISDAHEGHSHAATPTATSRSSFKSSIDSESPFAPTLKLRSGYEFGQFAGILPGFNTFFGNEDVSLNLNYEFQYREFSTSQNAQPQTNYADRDFNNHVSLQVKKSLSDLFDFTTSADYETSQALRLARSINDFQYYSVNPNLIYKLTDDWQLTAGYIFSQRLYPNGTYLIPSIAPTGAGEPIDPNSEPITTKSPITSEGITDIQNQALMNLSGNLNELLLQFEVKFLTNESDLESRIYNAQGAKIALEKRLWNRLFGQASYSSETRKFAERTDQTHITELGLQQELSARLSISGVARMNQLQTLQSTSYTEGYAQVQYVF